MNFRDMHEFISRSLKKRLSPEQVSKRKEWVSEDRKKRASRKYNLEGAWTPEAKSWEQRTMKRYPHGRAKARYGAVGHRGPAGQKWYGGKRVLREVRAEGRDHRAENKRILGGQASEFSDQHEFANRRARESRRMGAVIREGARRGGVNRADRDSAHRYNEDLSDAQWDAGQKLRIAEMPSSRLVRKSMEKKGMLPNIQRGQTSEFGEPMNFSDFYEFVRYSTPRARSGAFGKGPPKKGLSEEQIAENQANRAAKSKATDATSKPFYGDPKGRVIDADKTSWYINPETGGFQPKGYKPTQKQPNRIPAGRRGKLVSGRAHDVRESEGREGPGKIMGITSEFGDQHEFISRSLKRRLSPKHKKWYHTVSRRLRGAEVGERQERRNAAELYHPAFESERMSPVKAKLTRLQTDTGHRQEVSGKAGKKRWKEKETGVRVDTSGRGPATQYGINAGRDKRINQSEFGDMRNFSDEQFLLFFANQYPEAFHQVAGEFSEFGDHEFVRQAASEDWNPPRRGRRTDQPMSTREYKSSGKPRQGRKLKIKLQPGGTVSQADHDRMRWKYNTSEFGDQHEFVSRKARNVQRAKALHAEGMSRRVIRGGYPAGQEERAGKFKIARAHGDAGEEARQSTPPKHSSSEPSARLIRQQMETAGLLPNVGGVKTYPYKEALPGTMTRRARRETQYGGSHSEFSDPISRQPRPGEVDLLAQKEGYGIAGRHDLNRRGGVARRTQDMDINEGWRDPGSHDGPPAGRRYRSAHGGPRRIQLRGPGKKGRRGGQTSEFKEVSGETQRPDRLAQKGGHPGGRLARRGGLSRYLQDKDANQGWVGDYSTPDVTPPGTKYTSYHGSGGGRKRSVLGEKTRQYRGPGRNRPGSKRSVKKRQHPLEGQGGNWSKHDTDAIAAGKLVRYGKEAHSSEFSDLHEFDCKRRLAKGREMLKFMEGYYA